MLRVLIINSVPLNGGDQALLRATLAGLERYLPSPISVTVLCHDPLQSSPYLPDLALHWDYEHSLHRFSNRPWEKGKHLLQKLLRPFGIGPRLHRPDWFLASNNQKEVYALIQKADLVISSAGGYLHDFYGYRQRMEVFKFLLDLNKPLVLLGQSIGPFWKKENHDLLCKILPRISLIVLREKYSLAHLQALNIPLDKVVVHTDLAFGLARFYPQDQLLSKQQPVKKLAMSFRAWQDEQTTAQVLEKAIVFCQYLLEKYPLEITFLSTCQGIPVYHDDSQLAEQIVAQLPPELRQRCQINRQYHPGLDLIAEYGAFDAYIGMRLHGAILAMLGATPAMNIAYEDKTAGIYEFLDWSDYQVDYRQEMAEWQKTADRFLAELPQIQAQIPERLQRAADQVEQAFLRLPSILDS